MDVPWFLWRSLGAWPLIFQDKPCIDISVHVCVRPTFGWRAESEHQFQIQEEICACRSQTQGCWPLPTLLVCFPPGPFPKPSVSITRPGSGSVSSGIGQRIQIPRCGVPRLVEMPDCRGSERRPWSLQHCAVTSPQTQPRILYVANSHGILTQPPLPDRDSILTHKGGHRTSSRLIPCPVSPEHILTLSTVDFLSYRMINLCPAGCLGATPSMPTGFLPRWDNQKYRLCQMILSWEPTWYPVGNPCSSPSPDSLDSGHWVLKIVCPLQCLAPGPFLCSVNQDPTKSLYQWDQSCCCPCCQHLDTQDFGRGTVRSQERQRPVQEIPWTATYQPKSVAPGHIHKVK